MARKMKTQNTPALDVSPLETVAGYFRDLARRGLGCASNNLTIAGKLGLGIAEVRACKRELIRKRRLIGKWATWLSIDGMKFGEGIETEFDALKNALRRHFPLVVDVRTVDKPDSVPSGNPALLIVGDARLSIGDAWTLAQKLEPTLQRNC